MQQLTTPESSLLRYPAIWREPIDCDTIGWREVMNKFFAQVQKGEMKKFIAARDFLMFELNIRLKVLLKLG